jgi:diguanylate cyclase (GGDEF)-like protein
VKAVEARLSPAWIRPSPIRIAALAAALAYGFLVAHLAFGLGGQRLDGFADRWLYDAIEIAAGLACLLRAVTIRSERAAWAILGVGILSFAVGDIWFDFAYGGNPPAVSVSDIFYLAFYPACYAALALLVRSRISSFDRSVWLDGVIAAFAATAVSASIVLQVVLRHTHGSPTTVIVGLAYPAADLVLLAIVIFVLVLTGRRAGRAWAAAGIAFGAITIADSVFVYLNATGSYREGTLLDALWPGTMLLLAVAAWQPVERHAVRLEGRFFATPLLCGLAAVVVLADGRFEEHTVVADILAIAAIVTVFVRTGISLRDNALRLEHTQTQSLTDDLTGLGNRRSLMTTLGRELRHEGGAPMAFAIYDLNGFKRYNDTFGHPSGDALLARLAGRLALVAGDRGHAYRLGGDELCLLIRARRDELQSIIDEGLAALTEEGDGFSIGAEYGSVVLPEEAADPTSVLRLADERLYAQKYSYYREAKSHEVLLRVLEEREPGLRDHMRAVADLAVPIGKQMGLSGPALEELQLAAELHDIGKLAIPVAILEKPGPLTGEEWEFIRRHPVVGERIIAGAPAMREIGRIVRATHERWDGAGYADGLSGTDVPLAARIIAVCDAYGAMTTNRPYRRRMSPAEALAELRDCSGTQFDPEVVFAFCRHHDELARSRPQSTAIRAVG